MANDKVEVTPASPHFAPGQPELRVLQLTGRCMSALAPSVITATTDDNLMLLPDPDGGMR
jgi:hypothetical protein